MLFPLSLKSAEGEFPDCRHHADASVCGGMFTFYVLLGGMLVPNEGPQLEW